jgi:DNA repair protein RadC
MVPAAAPANQQSPRLADVRLAEPRNAPPALASALAPLFALHLDPRLIDEVFCVAGCDARGRLLAFAEQRGDAAHIAGALSAVRRILGNPAVAQIVIAHNHVSGRATPSAADKMSTRQIAALAQAAGATLADHLLFTAEEVVSFHAIGAL